MLLLDPQRKLLPGPTAEARSPLLRPGAQCWGPGAHSWGHGRTAEARGLTAEAWGPTAEAWDPNGPTVDRRHWCSRRCCAVCVVGSVFWHHIPVCVHSCKTFLTLHLTAC